MPIIILKSPLGPEQPIPEDTILTTEEVKGFSLSGCQHLQKYF